MSITTIGYIVVALLGPIGFGVGWIWGWSSGKAKYAETVGEQNMRLDQLAEEIDVLSRALHMRNGPRPTLDDLRVRLPEDAA